MLLQCFEQTQDPSVECPQKYSIKEILFSAIVAVLDGARSWDEVSFNAELYLRLAANAPFVRAGIRPLIPFMITLSASSKVV